jgi:hypothetical protein
MSVKVIPERKDLLNLAFEQTGIKSCLEQKARQNRIPNLKRRMIIAINPRRHSRLPADSFLADR